MIGEELDGDVLVLRLEHGRANAMDVELVRAIAARFAGLATTSAAAVVLTGNGSVFSAGVDLKRLLAEPPAYVDAFLPALSEAFEAVAAAPVPVVAAVDGPAIAGGCVLACAADVRVVAATSGRLGLTELAVGVPFPPVAIDTVRARVGPALTARLVLGADVLDARTALDVGLADVVVPDETLLGEAVAWARRLGSIPPDVLALTRRQLGGERTRDRPVEDHEVRSVWRREDTRDRVRTFLEGLRDRPRQGDRPPAP